ncbi:hypothetical protein NL676_009661 [Syzygium grande]|nr:hypothetical protein NL676_009661 [Syzygium grande]
MREKGPDRSASRAGIDSGATWRGTYGGVQFQLDGAGWSGGPGLTTVPQPFSVFCFLALLFREIRDLSPDLMGERFAISPDRVGDSTSVAASNVHLAERKIAASVRFGVVRLDRNEVSPPSEP